jgi:aerobic-type carbon monoxide dehydrogenase small subunit (CoxS/CutS family)
MAEAKEHPKAPTPESERSESDNPSKPRPPITRRDFLRHGQAGAIAVGMLGGTGFATMVPEPETAPQTSPADPATSRRVSLNVDGKTHDVTVDVRESLWETMNLQLGLSNCNLGCDRAQCGACTILVDGRAANGCALLTARQGRGQQILTAAGIANGPGVEGLHPIQRAFWFEGGFQCGICTRGFVMATYALLQSNANPTTEEIKDALAGNICRCGEYTKILKTVRTAAAEMRGEQVTYTAPPLETEDARAVTAVAGARTSRQFGFVTALGTIEQFDDLALELGQRPGILDVSGTERTVTPTWDPTRLDEARVRQILEELGYPVQP